MTERTRYRLTGAIFLIALAVIVLPMLFDGAGVEPPPLPQMAPVAVEPVEVETPELDEDALAEAEDVREAVDDEGFDESTGTRIGEPALTAADDPSRAPVDAWAVQVASFSEQTNAVYLRDRLRTDGFAAFLSDVKRGNGRSTRVAVGPILERAEAERLRGELARRYDADALVVRFEP